jgi:hypothetical protein
VKFDKNSRKLFKKLPKEIKDYFEEVDQKCKKHGITFRLGGGKSLNIPNGRCSGFFSDFTKELAVAIDRPLKWLMATLVHEECHFEQWLDENSIWYNEKISAGFQSFFEWLDGGLELKDPTKYAKNVIAVELDCEKRAFKKIKKRWSHIISPEDYAMTANAYMYSYLYMSYSRNWIKAKLRRKAFYKHFPAKLLNSFEELSDEQYDLFYRHEKAAPLLRGGC